MWNFLLSRTWFSAILSLPLKCFLAVSKSVCLCKFNVTCENKKVPFLPIMATHSCVSAYKPSISLCWIKYRYLLLCPFFSFCKCMYYLKKIYDEIIIYFFYCSSVDGHSIFWFVYGWGVMIRIWSYS